MRVRLWICSKLSEAESKPTEASYTNIAMSANTIRKVKDKNENVGHKAKVSIFQ